MRYILIFKILFVMALSKSFGQQNFVDSLLQSSSPEIVAELKELLASNSRSNKLPVRLYRTCLNTLKEYGSTIFTKEEYALLNKIKLISDTISYCSPTRIISSHWDKGEPVIEIKKCFYSYISNLLSAQLISTKENLKRFEYGVIFNHIQKITDSTIDAVERAGFSENEWNNYLTINTVQTIWTGFFFSVSFCLLHEFSHLSHPTFTEEQADSMAVAKFIPLTDMYIKNLYTDDIPDSYKKELRMTNENIKYFTLLQIYNVIDFMAFDLVLNIKNYFDTELELMSRKVNLLNTVSEKLYCNLGENSDSSICAVLISKANKVKESKNEFRVIKDVIEYIEEKRIPESLLADSLITLGGKEAPELLYSFAIYKLANNQQKIALELFEAGANLKSDDNYFKELSCIMAANIWELRRKDYLIAQSYFVRGWQVKKLMPGAYYYSNAQRLEELRRKK